MKRFLTKYRAPLRFTLALLPLAAAAGYLVIRYQIDLYDEGTLAAMLVQLGSTAVLLVVGTVQTVVYAALCGFFGYILAEKLGLMRPLRLEKGPLLRTLVVSIPLGLLFSLDYWTFGAWLPGTAVQTSAAAGLTVWGWASAILYGGVMEELFMRLFLMSLLALYGRYPLYELIVHPRIQKEFYKGAVHRDAFDRALAVYAGRLVYNGDLFTAADVTAFQAQYPQVEAIMVGRGLMADPALARRLRGGAPASRQELTAFHAALLEGYRQRLDGPAPVLHRMRELWNYLVERFDGTERPLKAIRKARDLPAYETAADEILRNCPMK